MERLMTELEQARADADHAHEVAEMLCDLCDERLPLAEECARAEALLPSSLRVGGSGPWEHAGHALSCACFLADRAAARVSRAEERLEAAEVEALVARLMGVFRATALLIVHGDDARVSAWKRAAEPSHMVRDHQTDVAGANLARGVETPGLLRDSESAP